MIRVFFAFNWREDMLRATRIRDCWSAEPGHEAAGCFDVAVWEAARQEGAGPFPGRGLSLIKRMIDDGLRDTSVTAVLVGAHTAGRRYIDHAIRKSIERGNGLLAIRIHALANSAGGTSSPGRNPLDDWALSDSGRAFSEVYPTYDWIENDGRTKCAAWFEEAAGGART